MSLKEFELHGYSFAEQPLNNVIVLQYRLLYCIRLVTSHFVVRSQCMCGLNFGAQPISIQQSAVFYAYRSLT